MLFAEAEGWRRWHRHEVLIINNYSPKAKWIFTNIHEPEANNCFSIITQVIIEIPKQKNVTILPQFAIVDKSSYHAARINVSRNPFLNSRSGKRKHFLWRSYWVKINQNVVSWSVLLSTMGTLHYSFLNNVFLLLLRVERVCKSFWKESWRVQVAHLHNAARAPSSRSRCFQLSTNPNKDFFRYL